MVQALCLRLVFSIYLLCADMGPLQVSGRCGTGGLVLLQTSRQQGMQFLNQSRMGRRTNKLGSVMGNLRTDVGGRTHGLTMWTGNRSLTGRQILSWLRLDLSCVITSGLLRLPARSSKVPLFKNVLSVMLPLHVMFTQSNVLFMNMFVRLKVNRTLHARRALLAACRAIRAPSLLEPAPLVCSRCDTLGGAVLAVRAQVRVTMPLIKGQSVLIQYDENGRWKERVVIRHIRGHEYWVASPEYELFPATLQTPPLRQMRLLPPSRSVPMGIAESECDLVSTDSVLEFFTNEELDAFEREVIALMGLADAPDEEVVEHTPASSSTECTIFKGAAPESGYVWLVGLPPPGSGLGIGDMLNVPAAAEPDGSPCFLRIAGVEEKVLCHYVEASTRWDFVHERIENMRTFKPSKDLMGIPPLGADARVLPVVRREHTGERFRAFGQSLHLFTEEDYDDWPIEGPRTTKWLCLQIVKSAPAPVARHHRWLRDADIPGTDRARFEHHILSEILERAVEYDGLQVSNLASFEMLSRRLQHIEQAHVENSQAPDYSGAEHFLGSSEKKGGALIAPGLSLHVATRFRDEASIAKEQRKARESRRPAAAAPPGPVAASPDKGLGKGKKGKKGKPAEPGAPEKV